jgi:hypothetical protein
MRLWMVCPLSSRSTGRQREAHLQTTSAASMSMQEQGIIVIRMRGSTWKRATSRFSLLRLHQFRDVKMLIEAQRRSFRNVHPEERRISS